MMDFKGFNLPEPVVRSIEGMGFTAPTPIQEKTIPFALEGRDILGSAQTGTGKTAAFVIPLVSKLVNSQNSSALILTPTRELASQIMETVRKLLSKFPGIKAATIIGGESMHKQIMQLKSRPRIIVGTPGRVNDHLSRGTLKISSTDFLVLDETDRMLDMGFGIQLDKIFKYLPENRQTLMFSATLPSNIIKISDRYLNNPERISIGSTTTPIDNITQEMIHTSDLDKYSKLLDQLAKHIGSTIIFVNTKHGAEKLVTKLIQENYQADAIHGDLQQNRRKRVMDAFRKKEYQILVATDVASRGIDIKDHDLIVINYDLPQCPEDYIHRIGRTGRNGSKGISISLVSPKDKKNLNAIRRMMDPKGDNRDDVESDNNKRFGRSFGSRKPFRDSRSNPRNASRGFARGDRDGRDTRDRRDSKDFGNVDHGRTYGNEGNGRHEGSARSIDGNNRYGNSSRGDGNSNYADSRSGGGTGRDRKRTYGTDSRSSDRSNGNIRYASNSGGNSDYSANNRSRSTSGRSSFSKSGRRTLGTRS
jgi:ATP-dependent RNA helicase DeaD